MPVPSSTTIHLLPQEEVSSALDRLAESQAEHITLVLPDKSVVGQGLIGLQVLADEAKRLKKVVTISSDSPHIRRMSKRVGLAIVGDGESVPEHGFVAGADVAELHPTAPDDAATPQVKPEADAAVTAPLPAATGSLGIWQRIKTGWRGRGWKWAAAVAVVLLLIGGGAVYVLDYYLPRATVTLFAEKQSIDRDVTLVADPNASEVNTKTLTIPASAVNATASKTQSFAATGSKDVGTTAEGVVTVFNNTNTEQTFESGTVLTSDNEQFVLAGSVTVAAATTETSTDPDSHQQTTVMTPGTADVDIVAADIGEEYNLDAKSTFVVADYDDSTYSARNDAALTGGSKKTVKVVTESDLDSALDTLQTGLTEEVEQALKANVPNGQDLIKGATEQEVSTKQYSQAVGDQVDTFSLTLEITANGLAVVQKDIESLLDTEVATKVPDGYRLDAEHSSIDTTVLSTDNDGAVQLTATYQAPVIPEVDQGALRQAIAGKKPNAVEDYLKNQPNLNGFDIVITPKLPGPFYHLPKVQSNITIKVEVK